MDNINKAIKDPTITVEVKKCFEPKLDNFGNTKMSCVVSYGGNEYFASFKQKQFHLAKVGNKVLGTRESYNGNFFYKWHQAEKSEMEKTFDNATSNKPNKAGLGAAYNLAFHFCLAKQLKKDGIYKNNAEFLDDVEMIAGQIHTRQDTFVNREGGKPIM
jgi:hypothetical protein